MTDLAVQSDRHSRHIRQLIDAVKQQRSLNQQLIARVQQLEARPRSVSEQIDAIPGRRIDTILSAEVAFTMDDLGNRGRPAQVTVSQDGPFIMTHYPMALWYPSAPSNATNLNRWRPVSTFPLPTQVVSTDIIDIGYELEDGGSMRYFQNEMRGPVLSRPDNIVPCAVPTEWAADGVLKFVPTYKAITFNGTTPPTEGILHIDFIGYRIVNM